MEQLNCIIKPGTTIWDNLKMIRKMGEESIDGMGSSIMCMKGSLKQGGDMEREHFGGLMGLSILESFHKDSRLDMEYFIEHLNKSSMKGTG